MVIERVKRGLNQGGQLTDKAYNNILMSKLDRMSNVINGLQSEIFMVNSLAMKPMRDALWLAVNRNYSNKRAGKPLERIINKLVALAVKGEPWAIKEVLDRIDGRVMSQLGDMADIGAITITWKNPSDHPPTDDNDQHTDNKPMIDVTPKVSE